jgi:hypothetical protein
MEEIDFILEAEPICKGFVWAADVRLVSKFEFVFVFAFVFVFKVKFVLP